MKNYPTTARQIAFKAIKGHKTSYRLWLGRVRGRPAWFWYGQGNSGYEYTQEDAMRSARRWLTNGFAGIERAN